MNRGLLVFSILLILAGAASGVYAVAIFGFFLLFPAVLSTPRPRASRFPTGTTQLPRRIAPRPAPTSEFQAATPPAPSALTTTPPPSPRPTATFSPALFPTAFFPSFSQPVPASQQSKETAQATPPQRDELLEFGALVAIVKLALG